MPVARALVALLGCCIDAAEEGPEACTCWEPEYDQEQQPIDRTTVPGTRATMCEDCAYRPDSPERTGDQRYSHTDPDDYDTPLALAKRGDVFWCHQGMRKPVRWRHPSGLTVDADVDAYAPPIREGVPFQADGQPGLRCAGWAAHAGAR